MGGLGGAQGLGGTQGLGWGAGGTQGLGWGAGGGTRAGVHGSLCPCLVLRAREVHASNVFTVACINSLPLPPSPLIDWNGAGLLNLGVCPLASRGFPHR